MHFGIKAPCKDCPFTTTCLKGWLGAARMQHIMRSLDYDHNLFSCHETTDKSFDDDQNYSPREKEGACAGALIYQEAHNQRAMLTRLAMAREDFDPAKLRGKARVFKSEAAAVKHHTHQGGHR